MASAKKKTKGKNFDFEQPVGGEKLRRDMLEDLVDRLLQHDSGVVIPGEGEDLKVAAKFHVQVTFNNETDQANFLERVQAEGIKARAFIS